MLTPDADEYLVKFIAFTIDKELNALCPEANAYTAKARSLVSNLKTNEVPAFTITPHTSDRLLIHALRNRPCEKRCSLVLSHPLPL